MQSPFHHGGAQLTLTSMAGLSALISTKNPIFRSGTKDFINFMEIASIDYKNELILLVDDDKVLGYYI